MSEIETQDVLDGEPEGEIAPHVEHDHEAGLEPAADVVDLAGSDLGVSGAALDELSGPLVEPDAMWDEVPAEGSALRPRSSVLDPVLDVPVSLVVELGRTRMTIGETLRIGRGSIVSLDKDAGEPADLLVNGQLIARGEVVAIDEEFGLRVTEVVSPERRLEAGRG
ncbi:MAG: flagellar motor switch protein FliN [Gaiellales bacterium]